MGKIEKRDDPSRPRFGKFIELTIDGDEIEEEVHGVGACKQLTAPYEQRVKGRVQVKGTKTGNRPKVHARTRG